MVTCTKKIATKDEKRHWCPAACHIRNCRCMHVEFSRISHGLYLPKREENF